MKPPQKIYYKRNLPHWYPVGRSLFFTWCLHGSLPEKVIRELRITRRRLEGRLESPSALISEARIREYKKLFAKVDCILDQCPTGFRWLAVAEVAVMVQQVILERNAHLYKLWSYVVMPNHVHLFVKPKKDVEVPVITQRLKGYTAIEANRILGRKGETFWQDECFDHWARDEDEFFRIVDYIENNPVKAGLVQRPEDWVWSSAAERKRRAMKRFKALT